MCYVKFKETNQICSPLKISQSINAESACDRNNKSMYSCFYESKKVFPSKHSSWWRPLEDVFCLRLQKTSWSRQICLPWPCVFRRRRLGQDQYIRLGHMSSRRLQDVFKTSSRRLAKTSSRRFEDVFRTSSRHPQDVLPRRLQDVFTINLWSVYKIC